MKVRFCTCYKFHRNTLGFWHGFKPQYKKYWMGQIINIGLTYWYFEIDMRDINDIQDFADSMKYPFVWKILKKLKK